MFKHILESAGEINWMAISALLTFFTVFMVSTVLAIRSNPKHIDRMANLPFDDENEKINA
ncbi:MAG: hypothetical protein AAF705_06365 [Bacteroidota bacterium]